MLMVNPFTLLCRSRLPGAHWHPLARVDPLAMACPSVFARFHIQLRYRHPSGVVSACMHNAKRRHVSYGEWCGRSLTGTPYAPAHKMTTGLPNFTTSTRGRWYCWADPTTAHQGAIGTSHRPGRYPSTKNICCTLQDTNELQRSGFAALPMQKNRAPACKLAGTHPSTGAKPVASTLRVFKTSYNKSNS